jgi:hypothetical protein
VGVRGQRGGRSCAGRGASEEEWRAGTDAPYLAEGVEIP